MTVSYTNIGGLGGLQSHPPNAYYTVLSHNYSGAAMATPFINHAH